MTVLKCVHSGGGQLQDENLTHADVLRIVELVEATQFSEFRLRVGEIEVQLRRKSVALPQSAAVTVSGAAAPACVFRTTPLNDLIRYLGSRSDIEYARVCFADTDLTVSAQRA